MLANERKEKIIDLLKSQGRADLEELSNLTEGSVSTLRRDLNDLESDGKLRRVHGGAELPHILSEELTISQKSVKNVHEKVLIATTALSKISDGDVLFLDAGTTTGAMIPGLVKSYKHLTIVTPSVTHASRLLSENLIVYILGGRVKRTTDAMIGSAALAQLSNYRFNTAFVGANAFDKKLGAMTPDSDEAALKSLAIAQSDKAYLVIDSSKIGQTSFVKFAEAKAVQVITEEDR
ncbi:MAG: DeoR/GlpR family DNA-binding transcription regulator [Streptococcaceae bacterium]|jgi:DeoR family fructose operon transcriptional repressor|nr:DeoR/GlpR family DNA-binding transcription regulator [Streptococcaceae bacterium]